MLPDAGAQAAALATSRMREFAARGVPGRIVQRQIFRLMEHQLDPVKAASVEAVIHWEITRPGGAGADRWQVVIDHGRARATRGFGRAPTLKITIDALRFIELVSGITTGPLLFTQGKLRLDGDLMLAARLPALFRMPRSRPSREG
jgi:hypothetical protein